MSPVKYSASTERPLSVRIGIKRAISHGTPALVSGNQFCRLRRRLRKQLTSRAASCQTARLLDRRFRELQSSRAGRGGVSDRAARLGVLDAFQNRLHLAGDLVGRERFSQKAGETGGH